MLSVGAVIQRLIVPDAHGVTADVALGYDEASVYMVRHAECRRLLHPVRDFLGMGLPLVTKLLVPYLWERAHSASTCYKHACTAKLCINSQRVVNHTALSYLIEPPLPCTEGCVRLQNNNGPYFGGVVGRVANRIAGARFPLDGMEHSLHANEGANTLHSGPAPAWNNRVWAIKESSDTSVTLTLHSPDGDQARQSVYSPASSPVVLKALHL